MNIVITGCSQGIGASLVRKFSKEHVVYGVSRSEQKLIDLKNSLPNPDSFNYFVADIATLDKSDVEKWTKGVSIDILINNAGVLVNKPFEEINYADYERVMGVNFWAVFHLSQLFINQLSAAKGQVLNISSMGGVNYSSKFPGLSLYSSSKGAVSILTECLAVELKSKKIRVNALALGAVQTEMLENAFPGFQADALPSQMADFIYNFTIAPSRLFNGQVIKVSSSTP